MTKLVFYFHTIFISCLLLTTDLFAQDYDANFAKPITTENGKFVYYELRPIKTTEGVLIFLDKNLGALSTNLETSDSWGDLYQWGRNTDGHEKRYSDTTYTMSRTFEVNHKMFIVDNKRANDWMVYQENDLWQGEKGLNNPCPCGYRLPTSSEWRALLALGYQMQRHSSGYYYLSIANGELILPCAGLRSAYTGNFQHMGTRGYYWASDVISKGTSGCLDFNRDDMLSNISVFGFRGFGRSIRCVRSE